MTAQAPRSASQADFTFKIAEVEAELKVTSLTGTEALSHLFEFQVALCSEEGALDVEQMLAKPCLLEIGDQNGSRFVHGIVRRFERTGQGRRHVFYEATVVPVQWLLSRRQRSRIFQQHNCSDMTVGGIIKQVFDDAGIPSDNYRFALSETYATREFVVQYRETELDFVSRMMEEEGIFYFFEHAADGHKMVIADSAVAHVVSATDAECVYRDPTGLSAHSTSLYALREAADIRSGVVRLKDFNFVQPSTDLGTQSTAESQSGLEISDYPGRYEEKSNGTRLSRVRLEAHQCRKRVLHMAGNVRGLIPGFKFTLSEHPDEQLNREYLVTDVLQRGTQPQSAGDDALGGEITYATEIRVIPSDVPFRPPCLTRRPTVRGSQTAIVVGPSGEEIYTDKYGRVKVQFHWDLEGEYDENSSCWIRVSQAMAGGQYGIMFLPRVGQEVVVDFLEGDPDRPLITGRVFNNDHMPPYTLPDEMTKSVIKTHSSKGGGGTNEICFEDLKDSEKLLIHAQKDFHRRVLNDCVQNTGNDHHLTVEQHKFELVKQNSHREIKLDANDKIGGKLSVKVEGDHGLEVGGNYSNKTASKLYLKADQEVVIEGAMGVTLKVGGNFIKVDASGVSIQGTLTKINSGGAAGSGTLVALAAPEATVAADEATPGADTTYQATPVETEALTPGSQQLAAVELPPEEEKITSWVEIEMVDEDGQPWANELYEITYPDGKTRRGKLDAKGQAHIGLKEPMDVQVTFPHLDTDAWQRDGGGA